MRDDDTVQQHDFTLVGRVRKGDDAAFEQLVERHQKRMLNIAYRIVGSYEDACEVVQDAFLSAYRNLGGFRAESSFATWLHAIVVNLSRNRLQQTGARTRREPLSIDDPLETEDGSLRIDPPSGGPSPSDQLEKKERDRAVHDCIGGLDPDFREVIVLRDIQGFAYGEICAMLKLAEGTVKSRLFRARDALKNCLKKALGNL